MLHDLKRGQQPKLQLGLDIHQRWILFNAHPGIRLQGQTALHMAAENGQTWIVEKLIEHKPKAKLQARDKKVPPWSCDSLS